MDFLFDDVRELNELVTIGRHGDLPLARIATAVAEEVGECIGAFNKLIDRRTQDPTHFLEEWSQAMLMLTWLGTTICPDKALEHELHAEMVRQRAKWKNAP